LVAFLLQVQETVTVLPPLLTELVIDVILPVVVVLPPDGEPAANANALEAMIIASAMTSVTILLVSFVPMGFVPPFLRYFLYS
jgi:hypothetical protein